MVLLNKEATWAAVDAEGHVFMFDEDDPPMPPPPPLPMPPPGMPPIEWRISDEGPELTSQMYIPYAAPAPPPMPPPAPPPPRMLPGRELTDVAVKPWGPLTVELASAVLLTILAVVGGVKARKHRMTRLHHTRDVATQTPAFTVDDFSPATHPPVAPREPKDGSYNC